MRAHFYAPPATTVFACLGGHCNLVQHCRAAALASKAVQPLLRLTCAAGADQGLVQINTSALESRVQLSGRLEPAGTRRKLAYFFVKQGKGGRRAQLPVPIYFSAAARRHPSRPLATMQAALSSPPTCRPAARRQTAGCGCWGCGRCAGPAAARRLRLGTWKVRGKQKGG